MTEPRQQGQLPEPVSEVLRDRVDEAMVRNIWREVGRRRTARSRIDWRYGPPVAAAAVALLAAGALWWTMSSAPGPLLVDSSTLRELPLEGSLELSDGTELTMHHALVDVLQNTGRDVTLQQHQGRMVFDIPPGGPRRWVIETDLASIEVVGTVFSIDRHQDQLRVEVQRGAVLVRGELVPGRVKRLEAGDSIRVRFTPPEREARPVPTGSAEPETRSADPVTSSTSEVLELDAPPPPPAPRWRTLADQGEHEQAYSALGPGGVARLAPRASVEDLFALADIARLSGHPQEAVAPLERLTIEHAQSSESALAAFTLGRVQLRLGQPARAASAFEQALEDGVPRDLEPDALARLAVAYRRAGQGAPARAAAARYLARFPNGPEAGQMRSIATARGVR